MSRKQLLTISLLVPLMAGSAVSHAGTTISDKRYWPDQARASTQADSFTRSYAGPAGRDWNAPQVEPASVTSGGSPLGRYQGGPKGR